MTGKFTDVMKAAKTEKKKSSKEERKKQSAQQEEIVNVCIKVPKSLRKEWTIKATQEDMSLKDFIIEAVNNQWGV